jgi:rhamnogalacturonan endolyase
MKPRTIMNIAVTIGTLLPLVTQANAQRQIEKLGRGMVAINQGDGRVYIGWRMLETDPDDIAFNLFRSTAGGYPVKLNNQPITESTNFVDNDADLTRSNAYFVRFVLNGKEQEASGRAVLEANPPERQYKSIRLQGSYTPDRVGIADLNGDGIYDYVVKHPRGTIDPGRRRRSPDTYKVEAYNGKTGKFMWRIDLGWNINLGIWFSPMVVYDLDGDGKAEVALKRASYAATFEQANISENGFVLEGPEYCSVLDGMTGKETARVDWIPRGNISDWGDNVGNRVNRNLIGVAYLDGKRPSLLVMRGTYTIMRIDAYNYIGKQLKKVWSWNGDDENPRVRGQGFHGLHSLDIDDDGRDELIIGAATIDDKGTCLWNMGMGHPDICYVADVDPTRPGLEIFYGFEDKQTRNGFCLAEARTGKIIWGCDHPTRHLHDWGLIGDIDPDVPGMELYAMERDRSQCWLYSARGKLLSSQDLGGHSPRAFYWTDGPIKVYSPFSYRSSSSRIMKYKGARIAEIPGRIVAISDCMGDWREELVTIAKGEVRIYTTTIPAGTRRVCLMQDHLYRMDVAMQTMGYFYPPQLGGAWSGDR